MEEHYGAEAVDYLAEPLLSGIYGGNPSDLSVTSVLPRFVELAAKYGSLTRGVLAERAKAANADFSRIADKYSFTRNGRLARYFAGITLHDMGDNSGGEKQLQEVAGSHDKEVASLAKLALASLDQDTGKTQQAIDLYKGLIDNPTTSVGKTTAQFELATLYEANHQPLEARKLYEQMQKADPTGQVGQLAAQKLQTLRPPQP